MTQEFQSLEDYKLQKFFEQSGEEIAQAINEEAQLNEAVVVAGLGALLAAPAFVKVLGSIVKGASKLFKWKKGEDIGEKLKAFSHKAEGYILKPIKGALKKLGVKEEKTEKWSKIILGVVIALLGVYSGLEAVQAFKAANIGKTSAEGILAALKGGETGEALLNTIKSAGARTAASAA